MSFFPHNPKELARQNKTRCQALVADGPRAPNFYQCWNKAVRTITITDATGSRRVRTCNIHDPKKAEARRKARGPTAYEREVSRAVEHAQIRERWKRLEAFVAKLVAEGRISSREVPRRSQ